MAIAFMAFACVRHLAYRVALQKRRMSPEVIRDALLHRQNSMLRHVRTGRRYAIPSPAWPETKLIYETLGLTWSDVPHALDGAESK